MFRRALITDEPDYRDSIPARPEDINYLLDLADSLGVDDFVFDNAPQLFTTNKLGIPGTISRKKLKQLIEQLETLRHT